MSTVFSLQNLTAPACIILGTAWVMISRNVADAFAFILMTGIVYVILVFIEWQIFCDDHYHGRR